MNKSTFDAVVGSYESAIRGVMLRRVPALAAVPDETLYALAERVCVAETFAPGQRVFERGDPGEKLFVVESGEAELIGFETEASHSSSPGGKKETEKEKTRRTTTLLPPGSWFGERALVHRPPRCKDSLAPYGQPPGPCAESEAGHARQAQRLQDVEQNKLWGFPAKIWGGCSAPPRGHPAAGA